MTSGPDHGAWLLAGPGPERRPPAVERACDLVPLLRRARASGDRAGALADRTVDGLRDAGLLRMGVPRAFGGLDLDAAGVVAVVERLAYGDASAGWVAGQVALGQAVLAHLDDESVAEVYDDGPDIMVAGAAAPKGRAHRDGDAWVASGRWPLVSGILHASWVYLQCAVTEDGTLPRAGEPPRGWRTIVVPAVEVKVLRTWSGLGLPATGSHDVQARGVRCPARRACDLTGDTAAAIAMGQVPVRTLAGLVAAGFLTGVAAAALDAVVRLATHKRPAFSAGRLGGSSRAQDVLGEATVSLDTARAMLFDALAPADGARADASARVAAVQAAELAVAVVDRAFALAGSSAVAGASPLQRCLRDARSIAQHATLSPDLYALLGDEVIAGEAAVPEAEVV